MANYNFIQALLDGLHLQGGAPPPGVVDPLGGSALPWMNRSLPSPAVDQSGSQRPAFGDPVMGGSAEPTPNVAGEAGPGGSPSGPGPAPSPLARIGGTIGGPASDPSPARKALMDIITRINGGGPETAETPDASGIGSTPVNSAGVPPGPATAAPAPGAVQRILSGLKTAAPVASAASDMTNPLGAIASGVRNGLPLAQGAMSSVLGEATPPTANAMPNPGPASAPADAALGGGGPAGLPGTTPVNLQGAPGPDNTNLMKLRQALEKAKQKQGQQQPVAPTPMAPQQAAPQNESSSVSPDSPTLLELGGMKITAQDVKDVIKATMQGAVPGSGNSGGNAFLRGMSGAARAADESETADKAAKSASAKTAFNQGMKTQENDRANSKEKRDAAHSRVQNAKLVAETMKTISPTTTIDTRTKVSTALTNYANSLAGQGITGDKAKQMIEQRARTITGDESFTQPGDGAPGSLGAAAGFQDGQTATGKGGQKIIVKGGQWVPAQ